MPVQSRFFFPWLIGWSSRSTINGRSTGLGSGLRLRAGSTHAGRGAGGRRGGDDWRAGKRLVARERAVDRGGAACRRDGDSRLGLGWLTGLTGLIARAPVGLPTAGEYWVSRNGDWSAELVTLRGLSSPSSASFCVPAPFWRRDELTGDGRLSVCTRRWGGQICPVRSAMVGSCTPRYRNTPLQRAGTGSERCPVAQRFALPTPRRHVPQAS